MIKNNSLSDRLNEFKRSQDQTQLISEEDFPETSNKFITGSILAIYAFIVIAVKSIVFGYTSKIIFTTNWNFIELVCVGFSINFLMTFIYELFHK